MDKTTTAKRHQFARQAYGLALEGLKYQVLRGLESNGGVKEFDVRRLARMGAAMAIKEAWLGSEGRPSDACLNWHNWVGIQPVGDQAHVGPIRKFETDEKCWVSWAYYPLFSTHYDVPRDILDTSLGFWQNDYTGIGAAYEFYALLFAKVYCPLDRRYGPDLLSIMEELAPVLGTNEPERRTDEWNGSH